MAPAHQRLDPHDLLALEVDDRLVDEEELVRLERVGQVHLQVHAVLRRGLHRGLEQHIAFLALGLRLVQRQVRILEQLLGRRR